jgi:TonB-dependent starch-binding outer membrane protein SusC
MKRTLQLSIVFLLLLSAVTTYAQRAVTGVVREGETNSPLPGVNVLVKGTANGTTTDADGKFTLAAADNDILVFSFIGMETQEITIGNQTSIQINMVANTRQLAEVVVTGYGDRSASSFTGSAVTLGTEKIRDVPMPTVDQALQGNIAGLQLAATSGTPGSVQDIRIRGISSINASNDPLFVIDGVPVVSGENVRETSTGTLSVLSALNQNDIENITVLKDAGATAMYGARGSNGVIIITTKKGKAGKPSLNVSAQYGSVDRAVEGPQMLNAAQWDELYYEAIVNAGYSATIADAKDDYPSGWDGVTDTDWRDVVANDKAKTLSYDISLNGGTDKTTYYTSLGYMKQDGINLGSNYERYSGKVSVNHIFTDKLSISNTLTPSFVEQNGQLESSAYFANPDAAYMFTWAIDKPRNDDGTPNLNLGTSTYNPLHTYKNNIRRREQVRVLDAMNLSYKFLDNLTFTSVLGMDYLVTEELYFYDKNYGDLADDGGGSYMYNNRNFNWTWKNMVDYSWQLNQSHKLDFKLVYEAQKNSYKTVAAGGVGFAADDLYYPTSVGTIDYGSGYVNDWAINSILGVVNYTFKDNIFVDATLRREGNSRFAPDQRWGTFYSLGASWVFSDEAFMDGLDWLSNSKLRVSYGKTGNAGINLNEYQATLAYTNSYNGIAGATPGQFGNNRLSWENSNAFNVGLDFGVFERVTGTAEYFQRTTYDLLLDVPLTRTSGFSSQRQNFGEMVNKGYELTLSADILKGDGFKWNVGFNYTKVENEVTELPTDGSGNEIGITTGTRKVTVGEPAYSWYMRTWAGVNPDTGAPTWYLAGKEGDVTSTYATAALSTQGANSTPTHFGGINTKIDFKGFYASASLYFSGGNKVYDTWGGYTQSDGRFTFGVANGYATQYDRWKQPGDLAKNPRNVYGNTSTSASNSTRRLYDGDFLRLRNVTIGYNFPKTLLSAIHLTSANIYVMGTNLWTKTYDKNLEFDPEVKADGFLDLNAPPVTTMVFGLRLGI